MILLCVAFTGLNCAPRIVTKVEYRDVLVPVRCNVTTPPRPKYEGDPVMGTISILEYVEKLETLLKVCTEEPGK